MCHNPVWPVNILQRWSDFDNSGTSNYYRIRIFPLGIMRYDAGYIIERSYNFNSSMLSLLQMIKPGPHV